MGRLAAASEAFTEIYNKDLWSLQSTEWLAEHAGYEPLDSCMQRWVNLLREFMRNNGIRSVVEFGCGFWSYAKSIDWTGIEYDAFDVYEGVVRWNREHHAAPNVRFHVLEDGTRLPAADLLITKDVLQHLPLADIHYYLDIFRRNYRFSIVGNGVLPEDNLNGEIPAGSCRSIRLDLAPFAIPSAVLQRWDYIEFGAPVAKEFRLLQGLPEAAEANGAVVRDSGA